MSLRTLGLAGALGLAVALAAGPVEAAQRHGGRGNAHHVYSRGPASGRHGGGYYYRSYRPYRYGAPRYDRPYGYYRPYPGSYYGYVPYPYAYGYGGGYGYGYVPYAPYRPYCGPRVRVGIGVGVVW
jgi:hypothetical protein